MNNNRVIYFFLLAFLSVGFVGICFHELWRDELQPWSIAKASHSFSELWFNSRYDARPILWYGFLFFISKTTDHTIFMQMSHLLFAGLAAFVFLRYSSFSPKDKLLIIFGYFFMYEYTVISRVYAPGILLLFLFCALYNRPSKSYLILSLILFFLSLNNVFACIISISLFLFSFYNYSSEKKWERASFNEKKIIITSVIIAIAGILSYVFIAMPPKDSAFTQDWYFFNSSERILQTLSAVWNGFFPIPDFSNYQFWNSNIISSLSLKAFLSFIIMGYCIVLFFTKRQILLLYLTGTLGILLFLHFKYTGYLRHHGHFFLLFIVCLWLEKNIEATPITSRIFFRLSSLAQRYKYIFVRTILLIHLAVMVYAYNMEIKYPFSASKMAAAFIRQNHLENKFIIGYRDVAASSIAAWLQKPIYNISSDSSSTFILFNKNRKEYDWNSEVIKKTEEVMKLHKQNDAILIFNAEPIQSENSELVIHLLKTFDISIVPDEVYYIYSAKQK